MLQPMRGRVSLPTLMTQEPALPPVIGDERQGWDISALPTPYTTCAVELILPQSHTQGWLTCAGSALQCFSGRGRDCSPSATVDEGPAAPLSVTGVRGKAKGHLSLPMLPHVRKTG